MRGLCGVDKFSGQVRYAVMSFGGFLGLGHSHYPLPWSSLTYDKRRGYTTNVTEQQLRDAPEFSDDSWKDRDWETRMPVQPYGMSLVRGTYRRVRAHCSRCDGG